MRRNIIIFLLAALATSFAGYKFMASQTVSPKLILSKAFEKAGFERPFSIIKPILFKEKYSDYTFQGTMKRSYPRILYKNKSNIETIRNRYETDLEYKKITDAYSKGASAWFCKKDFAQGDLALTNLLSSKISRPNAEGNYGSAVSFALRYDLLHDHPAWTPEKKQIVQKKFKKYLKHALRILNEDSASLWHGRFQLACTAWITASVIQIITDEDAELLSKAQAHFLDAVDAIRLTEGWPEGYNYWINNRAYSFALACLSHLNSVNEAPTLNNKIAKALETSGIWTIYGTRPDHRFALFGDTGPRNDLKDETQRFIDLVLLGTRNSLFKYYSAYLNTSRKGQGYYYGYRWGIPVFRGFAQLDFPKRFKLDDLSFADRTLPNSRLFGQGTFNQVFIRSGWEKDATFISFRAGHTFTHHGHYQAGHFTLFKHAPIAITSGTYGGYTSRHRLNYYIRTIASNSILIQKPGEIIRPNQYFKQNVAAGGQKIIIPTGSTITSVKNWNEKKRAYQGGTITAFDNTNPAYVYINSDLTKAYSQKKANRVTRKLCYLNSEDLLIIHDEVTSVKKEYKKKWIFHTWSKPSTHTETLLVGESDNGILTSTNTLIDISHLDGRAQLSILRPKHPLLYKIGGKDYRYYVETDGDDTIFNGTNMVDGANDKPWFDAGMWRLEISSQNENQYGEFLVVIQPGIAATPLKQKYHTISSSSVCGIATAQNVILFPKNNKPFYRVQTHASKDHIVFGLPENRVISLIINQKTIEKKVSRNGVLTFTGVPGKGKTNIEIKI